MEKPDEVRKEIGSHYLKFYTEKDVNLITRIA